MLEGGRKLSSWREMCRDQACDVSVEVNAFLSMLFYHFRSNTPQNFGPKCGRAASCRIPIRPLQATFTALNRAVIQFLKHSYNMQL